MEKYQDLIVWQKSMDLVEEVYHIVQLLPKEEKFNLVDQIKRAVVSIPSNIAEGFGRNSVREYIHFLNIARGSKYELETQLQVCLRVGYLNSHQIQKSMRLSVEIGKMLNTLISRLKSNYTNA